MGADEHEHTGEVLVLNILGDRRLASPPRDEVPRQVCTGLIARPELSTQSLPPVKEGLINRHLTFVPLAGVTIGPDNLQVTATKAQIKKAPNIGLNDLSQIDESNLYHYYQLNYTPLEESGRRLARR